MNAPATPRPAMGRRAPTPPQHWELYSGAAMIVICVGIAVLMLFTSGPPRIPEWLWGGLFLLAVSLVVLAVSGLLPRPWPLPVFAGAVLLSWLLLMAMPGQGLFIVIFVMIAAAGVSILPMPAILGLVVANSAVVMLHQLLAGADAPEVVATTVFCLLIHLASVFSSSAMQRESELRAELEEQHVELTAAAALLEDSAKASERLRISRELHDLIGHQLTVLSLELEAAKHRDAERRGVHVDRAAEVARELLRDVRSTVGELRAAERGGLRAHLERLGGAVPTLQVHVHVEEGVYPDEQQTAALVRAAQEIVTNAVKHANARELWLDVTRDAETIQLVGVDDGYPPGSIEFGNGLTGLRERVELLDGELRVEPRGEFTVEVRLPASARPASAAAEGAGA